MEWISRERERKRREETPQHFVQWSFRTAVVKAVAAEAASSLLGEGLDRLVFIHLRD